VKRQKVSSRAVGAAAALTGGAKKAIEALGNPDSGFGNGFARARMR
jgi:hypothetical protein